MYSFILMFEDYLASSNMHWFMLFFIFVLIRWVIVFFMSLRYKKYDAVSDKDADAVFSSVLIPVVDEPLDVFENVLTKILAQHPNELIIVVNGPYPKDLMALCHSLEQKCQKDSHPTKMLTLYTATAGKRNAIRLGLENVDADSDVCVLVDSDTIWTDGTLTELMKPFCQDDEVGGVTTRQKIFKPGRTLVTRIAGILEEVRAEGTMKAMSVTGKVGCLPGRTIAFRTSILRRVIHEFMTETFMGVHNEVSDDRSLTNLTLKLGYKTVLQDSSVVYTDAPTTWRKFSKQQMRWAAGSQYNNLKMTGWMFRHAPLMAFIYWADMLLPPLLFATYANIIICWILAHTGVAVYGFQYSDPIWLIVLLVFLFSILSFGLRHIRAFLKLRWHYFLFIPILIFILSFLMSYIRLVGLMRCADGTRWGTRDLTGETSAAAESSDSTDALAEGVERKRGNGFYRVLMRVTTTASILFFTVLAVFVEIAF